MPSQRGHDSAVARARKALLTRFVLDASVSLCWCFENQSTSYTERIFESMAGGAEAVVPFIWPAEMANALVTAERRKQITRARTTALLDAITAWPIHVDSSGLERAFRDVLHVARDYSLTSYDAAYLELALREALPFATVDQTLRKAARAARAAIVTFDR